MLNLLKRISIKKILPFYIFYFLTSVGCLVGVALAFVLGFAAGTFSPISPDIAKSLLSSIFGSITLLYFGLGLAYFLGRLYYHTREKLGWMA